MLVKMAATSYVGLQRFCKISKTQLAGAVDIRVEHGGDEFDAGGLVGVLLFEVHDEAEGAVFEGGVGGADYDCVPGEGSVSGVCEVCPSEWRGLWYQVMTLSAIGLALTPAGGSVCMRLKSRISLLRAAVDILS